jgi:hypothetical protein
MLTFDNFIQNTDKSKYFKSSLHMLHNSSLCNAATDLPLVTYKYPAAARTIRKLAITVKCPAS